MKSQEGISNATKIETLFQTTTILINNTKFMNLQCDKVLRGEMKSSSNIVNTFICQNLKHFVMKTLNDKFDRSGYSKGGLVF